MMWIRYLPVETWPGEVRGTSERRRALFKSTPGRTMTELEYELRFVGAQDVTVRGFWLEKDFRRDGSLRAGARPTSPGVILEYYAADEKYRFACDTFGFWEHNLKAIVKTLENLRGIDRWGVVKGEQYIGFKALPEKASETLTTDAALTIISTESGVPIDLVTRDVEQIRRAIRTARAKTHPDAINGNHDAFVRVNTAAELLGYTNG